MTSPREILNRIGSPRTRFPIPEEFIPDERQIIDGTPSSPRPWKFINKVFLFPKEPEKMRGLRVLDVGGGCSDTTARLLELGADAYSIDPKYASVLRIKEQGEWYLSELTEHIPEVPQGKQWLQELEEAYQAFLKSIKQDPSHYIPASATAIPFPDNFFNIAISNACIAGHLDVNMEVFRKSVKECLRVIKPGGALQLAPWAKPIIIRGIDNPLFERGVKAYQDLQISNQLTLLMEFLEKGWGGIRAVYHKPEIPDDPSYQSLTLCVVKVAGESHAYK